MFLTHNPEVIGSNPAPATNKNAGQPINMVGLFAFLALNEEPLGGGLGLWARIRGNGADIIPKMLAFGVKREPLRARG